MNDRGRLIYALFLLASFTVQLIILFITRRRFRFLRFATPTLAGAAGAALILLCCLTAPPGWAILLVPLAIVICLALAGLVLLGWALAWLAYYLINRKPNPI